jgi:hypothetical protein
LLTEIDEEIHIALNNHITNPDGTSFVKLTQILQAYDQFVFLFACIFNEIQNGPVSIPYSALASELSDQDTVLTFNWDTLFDRALLVSDKWSPVDGYFISPHNIYDDGWKTITDFNLPKSQITYLKLHGSTNWLCPHHGQNLRTGKPYTLSAHGMDKLFVYWKTTKPYKTYQDRYWGPYQPFSYCYYPPNLPIPRDIKKGYTNVKLIIAPDLPEHGQVSIADSEVYAMPLIIPPLHDKQYNKFGSLFVSLWEKAEQNIVNCNEMFLIGYSFPDTDIMTRTMFRRALKNNHGLSRIIVLNPNPGRIVELLKNDFGVKNSIIEVRKEYFQIPKGSTKIL